MAGHSKSFNRKRLRVLQIFAKPAMGGVENQLLAFLQRYDRDRFVVDVACLGGTEGILRDKFIATSTRLITCRWSSYIIPFVWRLFRLLRRERYDVIHARMSEVSGAAILAARLAGVPVRIASYDHVETAWSRPGIMTDLGVGVLQWMTRRWATKIYGVSHAVLDAYYSYWRQHPEQFLVCCNGVDSERFSGKVEPGEARMELNLPTGSLVVGHIGGFRKAKNHQTLVDVAERVSKQIRNVYFLLVGDGVLRRQVELEVETRGLSNRFVFTGVRKDVPRMLAAMDVFVMPSLNEGFGMVVVEAQLSGIPVVASDLPSIREALCPEMHKFCRDPHNAAGMAEQVNLLLQDPELRKKLGHEGHEYVSRKFSIDRIVKQLESIYNSA